MRWGRAFWAGVAGLGLSAQAAVFTIGPHQFTVPDGFTVELVAGPPLVDRPISADFDELGRLYVTDSSGSNDPVNKQLEEKTHRVVRLEDTNGDGRFDKQVVFADRMMFPEGAMWRDGSLYVSAPPSIWKLTDTNGDGVADQRVEWHQGKTLTGCANDLHGPYLGPDGWIYWAKGAFAEQTYERPGRDPFKSRAAHLFRARPDGSGIEAVMTGGMDNPVEIAFTPAGERIFTTTFFQHPGGGKRDGLVHAVYGGVYGKQHDVIEGHPRTGELMPVLTHLGAAAPSGLTRYASTVFGPDYQDNLFATLFNLRKVTRHELKPEGSGYRTVDHDFLVSNQHDFHPTDVLEDADGSLLVLDTGGWYKLCCPTSQLQKPDVLGAIYRIRRIGAPRVEDPRKLQFDWAAAQPELLVALLADNQAAVRRRAIREFERRGAASAQILSTVAMAGGQPSTGPRPIELEMRLGATWALCNLSGEQARATLRRLALDPHPDISLAALHAISLWRDTGAREMLVSILKEGPTPRHQRLAAEALGRIGGGESVPALLAAAAEPHDRPLEHAITHALIEIADADATQAGLASGQPLTRRAALVALDQMGGGRLQPLEVFRALDAEGVLRETGLWLLGRHPEWAAASVPFLRAKLALAGPAELALAETLLPRMAADDGVQKLAAQILNDPAHPDEARRVLLHAMAKARFNATANLWAEGLGQFLKTAQGGWLPDALRAARALRPLKNAPGILAENLRFIGADDSLPAPTRLLALASIPGHLGEADTATFNLIFSALAASQPVQDRALAMELLSHLELDYPHWVRLIDALPTFGPLEISRLLPLMGEVGWTPPLFATFAARVADPKVLPSVRPEAIDPILKSLPAALKPAGEQLAKLVKADQAALAERLEQTLATLPQGDIRRGQTLFNSERAACASCHEIGYVGGKLGPDLTRVGQTRTERDLLEAVMFPSASFVRSYEPVLVATADGEEHAGIIRSEGAEEILLAAGPELELRLPRATITGIRPGQSSLMPSGLAEQLTPQELADLIAFLKASR